MYHQKEFQLECCPHCLGVLPDGPSEDRFTVQVADTPALRRRSYQMVQKITNETGVRVEWSENEDHLYTLFVRNQFGQIIGGMGIYMLGLLGWDRGDELAWLYLAPSYRNRGIGSWLISGLPAHVSHRSYHYPYLPERYRQMLQISAEG